MKKSRKNHQCILRDSLPERAGFGQNLREVWRDLQDDQHWKYEESCPAQLLEILELHRYPTDHEELVRANWFWHRRPRFLKTASCVVWLIAALGLPLWLFIVPVIGVPLLIIGAMLVNTEIVRSVRWRRQYELSIDRLIRTSINGSSIHPGDLTI
jgi:Flp pilus assembly protein TadB